MPRHELDLNESQRSELRRVRDTAPKAYLRERAAALLKLAAGESVEAVGEHGLLRRRERHTLYAWLRRYRAEGLVGLTIRRGRGRKPAFFPSGAQRRRRPG